LFIPSLGGNMWRISQTVPNNGWSDWISHGQSGLFTNPPAIATNADGRLELYTPTNEGVCHIWQEKPNGDWADWFNQIPDSSSGPGLVGGSLALAPSADGRLELFMLGFDKAIWHIWQTQINGEWAAPISHGTPPNVQIQPNR
jgi:hypothetical protein